MSSILSLNVGLVTDNTITFLTTALPNYHSLPPTQIQHILSQLQWGHPKYRSIVPNVDIGWRKNRRRGFQSPKIAVPTYATLLPANRIRRWHPCLSIEHEMVHRSCCGRQSICLTCRVVWYNLVGVVSEGELTLIFFLSFLSLHGGVGWMWFILCFT